MRASQRKLDPERSRPHRPYHAHEEIEPLDPGSVYELDVEIWPTCIVLPAGFSLALTIGGHDFARPAESDADANAPPVFRGSGVFLHTDPNDRPAGVFDGSTTVHTGPERPSHVLLPLIPAAR